MECGLRIARRLRRSRRTPDRLDRRPAGVHRPQRDAREPGGARRRGAALQQRRRRSRSLRRAADHGRAAAERYASRSSSSSARPRAREDARNLIAHYRAADLDAVLSEVRRYWDDVLGAVQVKTPDRAMDIMLNGWLLYQTLACRIWARSAFYQASGAYGFRDQLAGWHGARRHAPGDDARASAARGGAAVRRGRRPALVAAAFRARACARASPTIGHGSPTPSPTMSARPAMPPFSTRWSRSWKASGCEAGEHDSFFQPTVSDETATLFEHCARGLDQSLALGAHGLPLIGTGDWNDGMNRVGERGQGESVWLGWLLHATLTAFAPLADARGETVRAATWRAHAAALQASLEREAWDGDWYRRGWFDDGTPLGSATSEECRIDSIAQSWAVISGAADPERAARAMAAVERELIRRKDGLALLFTPPFDKTPLDPGYIKGYPPGIRENGGQYTHAALWSVMAFAALGEGDKAAGLFSLLNPINHARTRADVHRYKVEPYVVAADVYAVAAPCRARRLDLVHRLGRLDAARRHREHPRAAPAGRSSASRPLHSEDLAALRDDGPVPLRALRNPGRESRWSRPGRSFCQF